jgi:opacity protein-like surface antigen
MADREPLRLRLRRRGHSRRRSATWAVAGSLVVRSCNYQAANWVFGIETDISGTKLDAGQTIATNVPPFFPVTSSVSQDITWIGTTRSRLGMAWGNVLVYATGGAAYANVNHGYTQSNTPLGPVAVAVTDSATQFGWTAGAGLEVGFGAWSVKGEYLYYDLGNQPRSRDAAIGRNRTKSQRNGEKPA